MTQKNIWNISVKELMEKYQVTEQGLTTARAEELRLEKGENILQESRRKSIPEVFISQFADLLVVILIIAAAISMFSGNAESTIVILLVLVINAILGTLQHVKAQRSLDSLRQLSSPGAKVIRDGVKREIPSKDIVLKDGDIINVDCSTILDGYFSDSSRMYLIGDVSEEKKKLVQVAKECLDVGLKEVKPWGFLGDMGQAINDYAEEHGYTIVREIGGHGIGLEFHEEPWVSYVSKRGTEMMMVPGLVFTIEPMVNMGKADIYEDDENGWTIYTEDGKPSAQWEIQVLVTEDGYEILSY